MQRVGVFVAGRDKEIFTDNEVDFVLGARRNAPQGGEVQ